MNKTFKEPYQPPMIEVIEAQYEGVMAGSPPNMNGEDWINNTSSTTGSSRRSTNTLQGTNTLQDFEDLINDILTVGK